MLDIEISNSGSPAHREASYFASTIYQRRHGVELTSFPEVACTASFKHEIIGCLGLTLGQFHDPLLLETYFSYDVLSFVSKGRSGREHFGELGTRAVDEVRIHESGISSTLLSIILTAEMVVHAQSIGLHHLLFTTNRSGRGIARPLRAQLIELGTPDLSRKSDSFRAHWGHFFKVPQFCFGVDVLQAAPGSALYRKSTISYAQHKLSP